MTHPPFPFGPALLFCPADRADRYAKALERGDSTAPLCVDCHGAHDVARATEPRGRISQTCARCHAGVAATYASSVHGRDLIDNNSPDVPACTDCHRAHDVRGGTR